ncbi:MAG: D-aminoacylase [Candidatus Aminicenantes bacterium]|nr:MAG: D-aminoacylase [Candidatus Aminicenantes bacterium]
MKNKILFLTILLFFAFFFLSGLNQASQEGSSKYDVLIKGGKILDGSLKPASKADVAVKDGIIVKIAKSIKEPAAKVINAKGFYVSPGFIDLHTHVDRGMYFPENRACLNYLKQGVTTVIVGQCGSSAWPVFEKAGDLMKVWTEEGIGPNAALLVGHGTVRQLVLGMEDRKPTPEELEKMKSLVKEAMEQGACGLSTGLIYLPGRYSETDEVIELVKVIAPYGGIYHTHVRNERDKLVDAVREAIEISEKSGAPVHISHFKVMGKSNWGLVKDACATIEEARANGIKVTADQYPYRFSSGYPYQSLIPGSVWRGEEDPKSLTSEDVETIFDHLRDSQLIELYKRVSPYVPLSEHHQQYLDELPRKWLVRLVGRTFISPGNFRGIGSPRERTLFLKRMNNPEEAAEIREKIRDHIDNLVGPDKFIVGICVERNLEGKSLSQVAAIKGKSISDTAIELELMGARCIPLQMLEDDIEYIMKKDYVGTGSDGTAPFYGIGLTHIRSYSTFLHKIKKYALTRKTTSIEHIIRSQTSLPAQIMNWNDRGWIKKGYKADIAVFDPKNIKIKTSISNPHAYSEGVKYLLINGELVLDGGKHTGKLPGKVIKLKKT